MAVRQEVNEVLNRLAELGDTEKIETYLADHPYLDDTLALEVHRDEYPSILTGLRNEHISRPHHANFIHLAARFVTGIPFRRP